MIEDEPLVGKGGGERDRFTHLARIHQDVVREAVAFERRDAAPECRTREEPIRLRLRDMPDAHELWMTYTVDLRVDGVRLQVDPSDNAGDEWVLVAQCPQ